jgi:hypothetical protein
MRVPDLTIVEGLGCHVGTRAAVSTSTSAAASPSSRSAIAITLRSRPHMRNSTDSGTRPNLYRTEPAEELAELLSVRFGGAQAFFCNSGAEAIEAALKYARKATGKTASSPSRAASTAARGRALRRRASRRSGAVRAARPGVAFVPPNDVAALTHAVDDGPGSILLEPVLGEGGVVPLEREFVAAAAALPPLSAWTRCRGASAAPARSSPSSSSASGPTSSRWRRACERAPDRRLLVGRRGAGASCRAITARHSAGIPWLRPPLAPSWRRSTTSCSRTCAREDPSS